MEINPACCKCGSKYATKEFIPVGAKEVRYPSNSANQFTSFYTKENGQPNEANLKEHLICECDTCGYVWAELCLDSPERHQDETKPMGSDSKFSMVPIGVRDSRGIELRNGDEVEVEYCHGGEGNIYHKNGTIMYHPPKFVILLDIFEDGLTPFDFNYFTKITKKFKPVEVPIILLNQG